VVGPAGLSTGDWIEATVAAIAASDALPRSPAGSAAGYLDRLCKAISIRYTDTSDQNSNSSRLSASGNSDEMKPAKKLTEAKGIAPRKSTGAGKNKITLAVREPQQGRSRESFERMLNAAERLLKEKGSDEFTLNEVSDLGRVSIGSIYCRFKGKDELVHAVQARAMAAIENEQCVAIDKVVESADNLEDLIIDLVEVIAETLKRHAPILRPLMHRASSDPIVAASGKKSYALVSDRVRNALLTHRNKIAQPDPERAARSAFRIFYSALARYLGFGSEMESAQEGNWGELKEDLGLMCAAFLVSNPRRRMGR